MPVKRNMRAVFLALFLGWLGTPAMAQEGPAADAPAPAQQAQPLPEVPQALIDELLGEESNLPLPLPQRNSRLAVALFNKLCIDMFGDFEGAAAWADEHLMKDPGWPDSDMMRGWLVLGRDTRLTLRIANGSKRFCMFGGGMVDANAAHKAFAEFRLDYAAREGHSVSPNDFTDKTYPVSPNEMPEGASYYGGAVFHSPDRPGGMDVVISTKRRGNYTGLVMDIALR